MAALEHGDPVDLIERAMKFVIAGDLEAASREVSRIDAAERWEEKQRSRRDVVAKAEASGIPTVVTKSQQGRNVAQRVRLEVFARDHYICRYEHCGRRTIDERVFAALSRSIPDALPYHQNWGRAKAHPMVWTHLASFEHVKPWSIGGDNSLSNLVTTCSLCNYTKMNYSPEQLGWSLGPEPDAAETWDGLLRHRAALERLTPRPHPASAPAPISLGSATTKSTRKSPDRSTSVAGTDLAVGNFVALKLIGNRAALRYRVVSIGDDTVGIVQMWRSSGRWQESETVRVIDPREYPSVALIEEDGPIAGDVAG